MNLPTDNGVHPRAWAVGATVLFVALVGAGLLALLNEGAREPIARNEAAQMRKLLNRLLPADSFDNDPQSDRILVSSPDLPGTAAGVAVYRARRAGAPVAAVITVVATHGYVGPITLLVSVLADGRVYRVHPLAHTETPGLGDAIDPARSDYLIQFRGRSVPDPVTGRWRLRRDGGDFDQITGATVTSRAVVTAVGDAARYFALHREEVFSMPATP